MNILNFNTYYSIKDWFGKFGSQPALSRWPGNRVIWKAQEWEQPNPCKVIRNCQCRSLFLHYLNRIARSLHLCSGNNCTGNELVRRWIETVISAELFAIYLYWKACWQFISFGWNPLWWNSKWPQESAANFGFYKPPSNATDYLTIIVLEK